MRLPRGLKRLGVILKISAVRFFAVSGSDYAAAFAFYGFFSLFPVILLLVSTASIFIDQEVAADSIVEALRDILPLDETHNKALVEMLDSVIDNKRSARFIGILGLIWAGLRFFKSLVHVQNLIWHSREVPWWHTPAKSATLLLALASALVLGIMIPAVFQAVRGLSFLQVEWVLNILNLGESLVPPLILFYSLFLFYKLSPQTQVLARDVWLPALVAATLITGSRKGFIALAKMTVEQYNLVYDIIGVIMVVLWSVYLSGLIIVFGGCAGAAIHETRTEDDKTGLL